MGLSLDHDPKQLVQAILEGIAFRASEVWNAMQQCVASSSPVPVDGGMSQNPYFVQFLSDCLGRTVQPANIPELTAIGTALLAAEGVGHPITFTPEFGNHVPQVDRSDGYRKFQQAVGMSRNWS
jgi:glycerol kinase